MSNFVIDLPFPVSANKRLGISFGRASVYMTKRYKKWIQQSDKQLLVDKVLRGKTPITGDFKAVICLNRDVRKLHDADNCNKVVLDYCQSRGLIANDNHQSETTVKWVPASEAPVGCRVYLTEVET